VHAIEPGRKLRDYWLSENCKLDPGVEPSTIREFERRAGCRMPDDFRQYFLTVNGLFSDHHNLRWWRLDELLPLQEADYPREGYLEDAHRIYVFADYLVHSHEYGIRLSGGSGPGKPRSIC